MIAVTLEYNNNSNVVLNGILDAVAKMPDVKIVKTLISKAKTKTKTEVQKMTTEEFSRLTLSEQAKILNDSIDKSVPEMTMDEIVKEVRAYRNEKK